MTTEHKNIYEAINAVMQEVGYVQKKKGGDIPYKFAGEAALIEALRPSMVAHGIVVYPAGVSEFKLERETSGKGTPYTHAHGLFSFVFQHIDSDTCVITQVVGEGIDYGDKAASKASTIAYKYALRQTFEIETGDDPDKYGSDNDFGGLKAGNGELQRGPSTNVKPVGAGGKPAAPTVPVAAHKPASAPEQSAQGQTQADSAELPLPPYDKKLCDMTGAELAQIQNNTWMALNMNHERHFRNRWMKRFSVRDLKGIEITFGDFMQVMSMEAAPGEEDEAA